uniref:Ankyrin repeat domain protein n=1 Tax=Wolbachia endosymbiont of Oeneis ivallda TaxID=3171168 RepID=A0AAU7YL73_9RICK
MSVTSILKPLGGFTKVPVNQLIELLKKNPKNIESLSFQNEGKDNGEAFNHYIEDFIKSANLEETQHLDLNWCEIDDRVIKALLEKSHTLKKFKRLLLMDHRLSAKGIEDLAQLEHSFKNRKEKFNVEHVQFYSSDECKAFYDFLKNEYKNQSSNTVNADSIKKMIFDIARSDNTGNWVKYILEQSEKYPFLINSRNEQNENILLFYNHSPEMKKFLFNHGLIPEEERNQRRDDEHIVQDNQSVHANSIVKRINFFAKKLVESTKDNKKQLKQAADSYLKSIEQLKQYQNDPVRLKLLNLTDNEKRIVMEKTLNSHDVPDDKGFIKTVIDKAKQTLEQKYLRKNSRNEYGQGYPTQGLQYDHTKDDAKITIPESIGRIKLLIDNFSIPLQEKKELLVTLMEQNPGLVRKKLPIIRKEFGNSDILNKVRFQKTELYMLLNSIDDSKKIDKLFKEISSLGIEKVWREQKEFILLKQIYIAATTYGKDQSACTQGTWSQIISSINEISSEIVAQYDRYLEEEQKLEAQKISITEGNIKPFIEDLANKLIQHVELYPELKKTLEDFAVLNSNINNPEEMTFTEQKILTEINKYFSENIKVFLPNYNRNIPNRAEYNLIINGLSEVAVLQNFVQVGPGPYDAEEILLKNVAVDNTGNTTLHDSVQTNNIKADSVQLNTLGNKSTSTIRSNTQGNSKQLSDPSQNNPALLQNTKRSKLPVTASSVLAIAVIVSGIAIAVYLEMLAVGIALGVCCLIAAAVIYCCNSPANSVENSTAEVIVNQNTSGRIIT